MAKLEAAKTAVWWDINRCAVPLGCCDPHRIARNVIAALSSAGCNGPVSIFAYGDVSRVPPGVLEALSATGVSLNHVSAGTKDGVDKKMLADMLFWAYDNPPPGNYLLISGDQDFSELLHRLKMKRYEILLAQPSNASSQALCAAARTVWLWQSLAAGEPLLEESPHPHSNRNSNHLDASKCSQSKVCAVYNKNGRNLKVGVKPLQKYVKRTDMTASFVSSQGQVEHVDGVSEDSTGSLVSELEFSSVSSSSSTAFSLSSSTESVEGAKVDQSSLLGTPNLSQSSAQKPEGSDHLQQVEILQGFILGEKPSASTKCAPINSVSCERKVKPLQKYVKKTNIAPSSGNQVDSVGVHDCFIIKSQVTRTELHLSTVLSSSPKSLEGGKVDHASPPGTSTIFQPSARNSVTCKEPSTRHTLKGNHNSGIEIGRHHTTYHQRCQTSQEQNKFHSRRNVSGNNGKSGNQYKVKQHQEYAKRTNISSSSASNDVYLGFSGNSKGSILGLPIKSMSSLSCSESLVGTEVSTPFSLSSSAQKPITPTHLHQGEEEFIFGMKPSTSVDCIPKNGTFCSGASNAHSDPTFQQIQSSLLLKPENSGPPHQHSASDQSYSMNSDTDSSLLTPAGHNGVPSSQQHTWASSSAFEGLDDICSGMGRLTISECPQRTIETRPPPQGPPINYSSSGVPYVSGYPDPNTSFYANHSTAPQSAQPPFCDCTCVPPHPPNVSCNMKNSGSHAETRGSLPSYSDLEGTILNALDILKTEKICPSESNIADCIHYGEMNLSGFDVKKALELAIRHQAVIMKKLVNDMPLFVAKDGSLWKCVDVTNSNAKHPKALDILHKFISSTDGHSAMKNSQSRYQAATILKKMCLQHHVLADVIQILHIAIVRKKWIVPHSSGWQLLSFNTIVVNATSNYVGESRS